MRRHYSTWDILAVVYWPPSQRVELERLTSRLRLSRPSRDAARLRTRFSRWASRSPWNRAFYAMWLAAIIFVAFLLLPGWGTGIRNVALSGGIALAMVGIMSTLSLQSRTNRDRYLAARRLREHNLVRTAPADIALLAVPIREHELIERRTYASRVIAGLPPARNLLAHSLDYPLLRATLFGLVPVFAAIQISIVWNQGHHNAPVLLRFIALTVAIWLVAAAISLIALKHRIRVATRRAACPDCGYPLVGVPSTSSSLHPDVNLGPKRCPECAAPWPLIPLALDPPRHAFTAPPPTPSTPAPPPPSNPHT